MIRRRMTIKRVDPWSVLKLGLFLNLAGGAIILLTGTFVWSVIRRLQVIERSCEQVQNIFGLEECAISGGSVLRMGLLTVLLWVVVLTAVLVFSAFLYNLIADLTGGVEFSAIDHSKDAAVVARTAGGGVEVSPELQQTSPRVVDARGRPAEGTTVPADAIDRRTREPSMLRKAMQAAAGMVGEASRNAGEVLTEATETAAEDRARRTQAATQAIDTVRPESVGWTDGTTPVRPRTGSGGGAGGGGSSRGGSSRDGSSRGRAGTSSGRPREQANRSGGRKSSDGGGSTSRAGSAQSPSRRDRGTDGVDRGRSSSRKAPGTLTRDATELDFERRPPKDSDGESKD